MRFSILLPTRNRLEYLRIAIESVRRQHYSNWEVIVSDNDSEQDVRGYLDSLHDPRFIYLRTDRFVSVTDNWNRALDASSGDYVLMLGDDDALMPGYFSTVVDSIGRYGSPEVLYSGAYLFAYPGVYPGYPQGLLNRFPDWFGPAPHPFWLDVRRARRAARDLLAFKRRFGLNMQFSLLSRPLIERLQSRGPVFDSPFPDYYATCTTFLVAERILVDPRPLVVIGITPKSYGFFHYNHQEQGGIAFLNSLVVPERLREAILPGTNAYTSWLLAMDAVQSRYPFEARGGIDYRRYRMLQTLHCYAELWHGRLSKQELRELRSRLPWLEGLIYAVAFSLVQLAQRMSPRPLHRLIAMLLSLLTKAMRSSAEWVPSEEPGRYHDLLDVFEALECKPAA